MHQSIRDPRNPAPNGVAHADSDHARPDRCCCPSNVLVRRRAQAIAATAREIGRQRRHDRRGDRRPRPSARHRRACRRPRRHTRAIRTRGARSLDLARAQPMGPARTRERGGLHSTPGVRDHRRRAVRQCGAGPRRAGARVGAERRDPSRRTAARRGRGALGATRHLGQRTARSARGLYSETSAIRAPAPRSQKHTKRKKQP